MTPETQKRRALAERLADRYRADPRVAAILLIGSVAKDLTDPHSDLDLAVYYSSAISPEELAAIQASATATGGISYGGTPEGFVVSRYEDGIKCDIAHSTIAYWHELVAEVLEKHEAKSPYQKVLSGVLSGVPLYGDACLAALKQAATYPEPLRLAMVRAHLDFLPTSVLEQQIAARGETLWMLQAVSHAATNLLSILCGLNRVYHWGEFKRQDRFCASLAIAPRDLGPRLNHALQTLDPRGLHALLEETFALVEKELPELDLTAVRARLNRP